MSVVPLKPDLELGREELGGKAFSVLRMLRLGIPVPPAFTITTDECVRFHAAGGRLPEDVATQLMSSIGWLEDESGRTFGKAERRLLVSVRSGAPVSMPGMMDTVLNLGIDADGEAAIAAETGDPAFAADVHRRFREQFAEVVGHPAPASPRDQLHDAVCAVFRSYFSRRAVHYREDRGIPEAGTAVTVQAMVFGNVDGRSGTGVLFSRNPLNGDAAPFGEWLARAQGEDVVSGRHDPLPLDALASEQPDVHADLLRHMRALERDGRDVQDIEFTVERGRLWLLQARAAKRSAEAAVRHAVALEAEGLIDRAAALDRVSAEQVEAALREHPDPAASATARVLAEGKPAAPGCVSGVVVTDPDEAEDRALDGEDVVLARVTTSPDDVHAMSAVAAILTEVGGSTSHAAVVSRELDTPCVVGCGAGTVTSLAGRAVTVDAGAGVVLDGIVPTVAVDAAQDPALRTLHRWAADEAGDDQAPLVDLLRRRSAAAV